MNRPNYVNEVNYKCLKDLNRNSEDLYLVYCGMEDTPPLHSVGPYRREEYILHYVLRGQGTYTIHGQTHHLAAHDLFLIPPDEMIAYCSDAKDPWHYIWVGFHGLRAGEILQAAGFSRNRYTLHSEQEEALISCVSNMLDAWTLHYYNDLKRLGYLYTFFALLSEEYSHKSQDNPPYDYPTNVYVEQALDFIRLNYQSHIKVTDIAGYIGITRSYLTYCFQKVLDTSPQQFLIGYRLNKAANLLKTTRDSIQNIARLSGYEDALAFSKAFKKHFKAGPKSYREEFMALHGGISEEE